MKATGIVRMIDVLGRIVIPVEIRKRFGWEDGTPIEIYTHENGVYLKTYDVQCVFCGNNERLIEVHDRRMCLDCLNEAEKMKSGLPALESNIGA